MQLLRSTRFFAVLLAVLTLGAVPACNTLEGAGQDLENAGEGVDEAAEDVTD